MANAFRNLELLLLQEHAVHHNIELNHAVLMAELNDQQFHEEFRFSRENIILLRDIIEPHMHNWNLRTRGLSLTDALLLTLQWLGTGNYLWNLRRVKDCSTTTIWRNIWSIVDGITSAQMVSDWIKWPIGNDLIRHSSYFGEKYHLANILGVVDGTHIPIMSPSKDPFELAYVNRKHYHSLNVQIVCGANYEIIHVDASNVGSAHDARVWTESDVPQLIQAANRSLLGDSAYPCRWYILTPYDARMRNQLDINQLQFQRRILAARQNVEQTIGILKQRFHVLQRPARYALEKVPKVILACCILHNICRKREIPHHLFQLIIENDEEENQDNRVGNVVRQDYINRHIL